MYSAHIKSKVAYGASRILSHTSKNTHCPFMPLSKTFRVSTDYGDNAKSVFHAFLKIEHNGVTYKQPLRKQQLEILKHFHDF
jgi:hypothetical protein